MRRSLAWAAAAAAVAFLVASVEIRSSPGAPEAAGASPPAEPRPLSRAASERLLAGSPPRLARLHRQGGLLLDGGLAERIAALRGLPVVVNVWASWCPPCSRELPLLGRASIVFGARAAFLGADLEDEAGDARAALGRQRLAYPSYAAGRDEVAAIAPLEGTPETVFLEPGGQVADVHYGAYESQAALDADIRRYAVSG